MPKVKTISKGDIIYQKMIDAGMCHSELSVESGVSERTIYKLIETTNSSLKTLSKVARALKCNVGEISEVKSNEKDI